VLKNSATEKSRSKTGTRFAESPPFQTSFPDARFRGKKFCEIDRLPAGTEFFNTISRRADI
jgi:hypothetical protein